MSKKAATTQSRCMLYDSESQLPHVQIDLSHLYVSECTSANIYIQYNSILKEETDTTPTFSLKQGLFTVCLAHQHVSLLTSDHSQSIFLCIN